MTKEEDILYDEQDEEQDLSVKKNIMPTLQMPKWIVYINDIKRKNWLFILRISEILYGMLKRQAF